MAGDWIPRQKGLSRKEEVATIARVTGKHRRWVAEALCEFWDWCDEVSADGCLGVLLEDLPGLIPETDMVFWQAVVSVGWLRVAATGLTVPHFERWLGNSAKKRLSNNRTQAAIRAQKTKGRGGTSLPVIELSSKNVTTSSVLSEDLKGNGGAGERGPPPEVEVSPELLADQWCFVLERRRLGAPRDLPADMAREFRELIRLGHNPRVMLDEILRPQRDRGEYFWQFKKRVTGETSHAKHANGVAAIHRVGADESKLRAYDAKTKRATQASSHQPPAGGSPLPTQAGPNSPAADGADQCGSLG